MYIDDIEFKNDLPAGMPLASGSAEIIFLGRESSFSDCLVKATAGALGSVGIRRVATICQFRQLPPDALSALRLLVLDEETLASFETAASAVARPVPVALAYMSDEFVRKVHAAPPGNARVESFLPLDMRFDIWVSVLQLLLSGGRYVPPELHLATEPPRPASEPAASAHCIGPLTPREREVLGLVATGLPNKTIAARLELSEHTVKLHIHHVISKLGVHNRTEAALKYFGKS